MTFAALQKDLTVGELYIRVLCGKINIRVDVNVRDVDLVGVLGVFIDNGICLFVVVVVAGEVFFGRKDINVDVLVDVFDIIDLFLRQLEDLVGGQVNRDGIPIDEDRNDYID